MSDCFIHLHLILSPYHAFTFIDILVFAKSSQHWINLPRIFRCLQPGFDRYSAWQYGHEKCGCRLYYVLPRLWVVLLLVNLLPPLPEWHVTEELPRRKHLEAQDEKERHIIGWLHCRLCTGNCQPPEWDIILDVYIYSFKNFKYFC